MTAREAIIALGGLRQITRLFEREERRAAWHEEREAVAKAHIRAGTHRRVTDPKTGEQHLWHVPKGERPLCGARTRAGGCCRAHVVPGMQRCRLHGGASTGPRTAEGKVRIAQANLRRAELRRRVSEEHAATAAAKALASVTDTCETP